MGDNVRMINDNKIDSIINSIKLKLNKFHYET